jgi:hypothetical protein
MNGAEALLHLELQAASSTWSCNKYLLDQKVRSNISHNAEMESNHQAVKKG